MSKDERAKALQAALTQIEKDFGKEAIMKLGDKPMRSGVEVIPTGALPLDIAIGVGGIPKGRVVEIFGPEAGGKSTLAMVIAAQSQKAGGTAAYIDAEHAFDPAYAQKLGIDIENLLISQPDSGEQALEITERLVRSGAVDIIVVDSVAALVPKSEIDGDMGDPQMGMQARLMSQALRKLTAIISKTNTVVIFINQLRHKIGVMFGNPETTPGGLALKFYSSLRLDIRAIERIKRGDVVIGNRVRVKVVKNKVAPPFRQAEFDLIFGEGISRESSLIDMAVENGIVEKSGSWLIYKNEKIAQGHDQAKAFLKQNPQVADELEKALREKLMPGFAEVPVPHEKSGLEKAEPEKQEKEDKKSKKK